jgi:hypothetical protein
VNENPAGYAWLIERYELRVPRPRHESWVRRAGGSRIPRREGLRDLESFPASYQPADTDFDHLVFALKYDGLDLGALKQAFLRTDRAVLAERIVGQPTSAYGRRLFFLFEFLTGERLPISDLSGVTYCQVLEPGEYFVGLGTRRPRYRVIDNLLGDAGFCPTVRRSPELVAWTKRDLQARAEQITSTADQTLLARAIWYLYTKETKSSFAIEREDPGDRTERFAEQLAAIGLIDLDAEQALVELQNEIVDERYREKRFRSPGDPEVYVGETLRWGKARVHHIGARSAITSEIMKAWAAMRQVSGDGGAIVEAACRSFAFVFIHPFGDGNGRIHRLLLHNILARRGYFRHDLVVPISAVILRQPSEYDRVLEDFSSQVVALTEYTLDELGELTVRASPDDAYRYPDLTPQCEATFRWLERALEEDLLQQLAFLRRYDDIIRQLRTVVEMPDKKEQLFIRLCLQNNGRLSKNKRGLFSELSDDIIQRLEAIVEQGLRDE